MDRRHFLRTAVFAGASAVLLPTFKMVGRSTALAAASADEPRQLTVGTRSLDINGKAASVYALTGDDGRPGLSFTEGDRLKVSLTNSLTEPTIVHWHGMKPPFGEDGVGDNPLPMLAAGETRDYDFPVGATGTHWMHAHTLQEQNLLAAPLIVRSKQEASADEQEVVILLHDFSFTPAEELLARLRKGNTCGGGMEQLDMSSMSMGADRMSMPRMAMDVNDIAYDAYLANDRTLDDPEVIKVERRGKVRLRIINGATSTVFTIDTGKIDGTLVAVDGHAVAPLPGRQFALAMGQRIDILMSLPPERAAYPILALREGAAERTGIVLAVAGAAIGKISPLADRPGPIMGLELETRLRAAQPMIDKPAGRVYSVMLMGNMATYQWGMMPANPLAVAKSERVEVTLMNHSMMSHPMHLHGHSFQVVAIGQNRLAGAVRDTVQVPPMSSVTVAFDADNPGKWPLHCHHLYHMASGMMGFVAYDGFA